MSYRPFAVEPDHFNETSQHDITASVYDIDGDIVVGKVKLEIFIMDGSLSAWQGDKELTNLKDWFKDEIEGELAKQWIEFKGWDLY